MSTPTPSAPSEIALKGLHVRRLSGSGSADRERVFAEQWAAKPRQLQMLMTVPCDPADEGAFRALNYGWMKNPIGETTERDEQIAATVMQWLGTNVGFCFLEETLKKAGYKIR